MGVIEVMAEMNGVMGRWNKNLTLCEWGNGKIILLLIYVMSKNAICDLFHLIISCHVESNLANED